MSPRAACRLETLGFTDVYDYVAGKVDWLAHNLPTEGERAGDAIAGAVARDDVVTCGPQDGIGDVRAAIAGSAYGFGLVVTAGAVVLGRLHGSALEGEASRPAEEAMEPGPSTVRPHREAAALATHLAKGGFRYAIVTDPEGRLIGIASRDDLERA